MNLCTLVGLPIGGDWPFKVKSPSAPTRLNGLFAALALVGHSLTAQPTSRLDSVPLLDATRLVGSLAALAADSMEGRRTGTPGAAMARAYLLREFARIGLHPALERFTIPFSARSRIAERPPIPPPSFPSRPGSSSRESALSSSFYPTMFGTNLVGLVRGTAHPDRYIVVSAHYDHLGVTNGEIYHGADDNASGTAAVLAIAEWTVTHPPLNSILFAWFDGEEEGELGSSAFVAHSPVPVAQIAADVNVDMVSRSSRGELFAAGARPYPVMRPLLDSVAAINLITLRQGHDGDSSEEDWTHRSDMGPFHDKHIPFVHFGVEEHADYHRPSDTADHIHPAFYYRSVRTIAEFIRRLDISLDRVASVRNGRE